MTTEIIDTPEVLYGLSPVSDADGLARAINRLATAIEQNTLALLDQRIPPAVMTPPLASLPPVRSEQPNPQVDGCPIHHVPWKTVPAGVSKKTGNKYDAFRACAVAGCDQRPPR